MTRTTRQDMIVINMGIDTLLECVRQTEAWWRSHGDDEALRRTRELGSAILLHVGNSFVDADSTDAQVAEAFIVAEGLREAAKQCREGQSALNARLIGGAEVIEPVSGGAELLSGSAGFLPEHIRILLE